MVRCIERLSAAELRAKLRGLSSDHATLAFVGTGQGTGKTTALQAFLDAHAGGEPVGVTSVGVDGAELNGAAERSRAVLTVPPGSILATASGCLAHGDITREILADTGVHTPLGEVLIVKARSGGWIELAGPSVVADLMRVCRLLETHGARRVFVDGAQGRLSLAAPSGSGAAVFTVRLDPARSVENCVADAARVLGQLTLAAAPADVCRQYLVPERGERPAKLLVIDRDAGKSRGFASAEMGRETVDAIRASTVAIGIRGAVTNEFVDRLLGQKPEARESGWAGLMLVVEDGTRLFVDDRRRERLRAAGIAVRAARPLTVACVAMHPGPALAGPDAAPVVMKALSAAVPLPLVDVIGGWYAAGI
ncbi:MAG TPA: hypothetical protein PLP29_04860 [Candidatus Ozemobacteraceae bacterium]|nr:hypothetical protein [Candidatus Ozemobacteraceae bacterium]